MPTHSEVSCGRLFSKQAFADPDFAVDPQGMTVFHAVLLSIDYCPRTGSRIRISDPPCCDVCATIDESILSICSVFFFLSTSTERSRVDGNGTSGASLFIPLGLSLEANAEQDCFACRAAPGPPERDSSFIATRGSQLVEPWSLPGVLVVCGSVLGRLSSTKCCWFVPHKPRILAQHQKCGGGPHRQKHSDDHGQAGRCDHDPAPAGIQLH